MQGHNELRLCKADLMRAIEYWLNEEVLREEVEVADVKELASDGTFVVKLKPTELIAKMSKDAS